MPTLAQIFEKNHPDRWRKLKRLPDDQYKKVMLSFALTDAVIDYLLEADAETIYSLSLRLDNIEIEHIKK